MNTSNDAREDYEHELYDGTKDVNADQDYWFKLRGDNENKLIDAATPLLGLSLRIRTSNEISDADSLYNQVVDEITAIELEMVQDGVEHPTVMAYRYVLCSVVDEAVMSTKWGAESQWVKHSLLTRFHNETWGGSKVYSILERLLVEPEKYYQLLSFIYLCLMLGFEGKYKLEKGGKEVREQIAKNLYQTLKNIDDTKPEPILKATNHVISTKYRLSRQMPLWLVFVGFSGLWVAVYIIYRYLLYTKSIDVLEKLNQIL